jgi:hypothetical protein
MLASDRIRGQPPAPGTATFTCPARTAHRVPVQYHEIALGHVGDTGARGLHDACAS